MDSREILNWYISNRFLLIQGFKFFLLIWFELATWWTIGYFIFIYNVQFIRTIFESVKTNAYFCILQTLYNGIVRCFLMHGCWSLQFFFHTWPSTVFPFLFVWPIVISTPAGTKFSALPTSALGPVPGARWLTYRKHEADCIGRRGVGSARETETMHSCSCSQGWGH